MSAPWTHTLVGMATAKRLAARAAREGLSVQGFGQMYAGERGWGYPNTAALLAEWAAFETPFSFACEGERLNAEMRTALVAGDLAELEDGRFPGSSRLNPVTDAGRALSRRVRDAQTRLALLSSHAAALEQMHARS